jgi:hypothetical protein
MSNTAAPVTNAAVSLRTTLPNSKWLGSPCPACQNPIAQGEPVVLCPKCYTPQHAQCWRGNGNTCAIDQTPARIIERAARAPSAEAAAPPPPAAASPAQPVRDAAPPAAAQPAAAASPASAVPTDPVDPYRYARPVEAPQLSDVWRRNIMTIVMLLFIWGVIILVVAVFGLDPRGL